ncbi:hypothetical protein AQJ11_35805 [Streptomyces corchorusii]|uniref:Uncharacterized protein n=1 Tax=Streptomyces corchorusii TaxID=1903 RepID=A0A101PUR2_STRCK|nr:hypothetical protein AQJ11_35805 [Streptomyces corchorusii]
MHAVGGLHLAGVRLCAAAPVPLDLFQARADGVGVERARQRPLFEVAAVLQTDKAKRPAAGALSGFPGGGGTDGGRGDRTRVAWWRRIDGVSVRLRHPWLARLGADAAHRAIGRSLK